MIPAFHLENDEDYLPNSKGNKRIKEVLLDIEQNHNHSWYQEMCLRSKKFSDYPAIFYRGSTVSFSEMMDEARKLAYAMYSLGIRPGCEVGVCMCNVPELAYVMLAINHLSAKMNSFSADYNEEYVRTIISGCTNKLIIATDSEFLKIKELIKESDIEKAIIISRGRSLPQKPASCKEYEPELDDYYHYNDHSEECFGFSDKCISYDDFIERYVGNEEISISSSLDTEFLISYTSGSTKIGFPKAIIHTNRSLIVSGRFHDAEVSGNPDLKGLRALAMIHPDSNTCLITCISDILMQGWCVAFEPDYNVNSALDYLILNKPNYANMTSSFWNMAAYKYLVEKKYADRKLGFLLAAFAVGENIGNGEEYFLNKFLRKARAGSALSIKGFHMPYVTISTGGGDCEHGGIYYTLWKTLYSRLNCFKLHGKPIGMIPEKYVVVTALKGHNGKLKECRKNELGIIAANSATTMQGYKCNIEETCKKVLMDENGRSWVSCNVVGFIDEVGAVHVKGRAEDYIVLGDEKVYPFHIDDVIDRDKKNILSSTTVFKSNGTIVANLLLNPLTKDDGAEILERVKERCRKELSVEVVDRIRYRVFDSISDFPITQSGKRNIRRLEELKDKEIVTIHNVTNHDEVTEKLKNNA